MTFDLHYPKDKKAKAFKMWVKRIYLVSTTLGIGYSELWDLPEQEFLVLESDSNELIERKKKAQEELRSNSGRGGMNV